jgi:hypothetical protein
VAVVPREAIAPGAANPAGQQFAAAFDAKVAEDRFDVLVDCVAGESETQGRRQRLCLEALEDRTVRSTISIANASINEIGDVASLISYRKPFVDKNLCHSRNTPILRAQSAGL